MAHHGGSGGTAGGGAFGDTTLTKVFVGGLAWETQRETMSRYFEQFGEILEAAVISDKNTGRSKGYGFVTFRDPESARRACADPTPVIDGRRTNCNLACFGARSRPSPSPLGGVQFRAFHQAISAAAGSSYVTTPPAYTQYAYQQGLYAYPSPYGYPAYSADYAHYPQNSVYNPYVGGAQYAAMYAGQSVANPSVYTYSAYGQPLHYGPMYAAAPTQAAYALQAPPHLLQYGTTGYTGMPQYAGALPIHPVTPASSGYSLQMHTNMSQAQSSMQQFTIAHQLHQQQGGSSEQPTG